MRASWNSPLTRSSTSVGLAVPSSVGTRPDKSAEAEDCVRNGHPAFCVSSYVPVPAVGTGGFTAAQYESNHEFVSGRKLHLRPMPRLPHCEAQIVQEA